MYAYIPEHFILPWQAYFYIFQSQGTLLLKTTMAGLLTWTFEYTKAPHRMRELTSIQTYACPVTGKRNTFRDLFSAPVKYLFLILLFSVAIFLLAKCIFFSQKRRHFFLISYQQEKFSISTQTIRQHATFMPSCAFH